MNLDEMTVKELREAAKERGIDLTGKTKKEEILAAIQTAGPEAEEEAEAAPEAVEAPEEIPEPAPETEPEKAGEAAEAPEPEQKGYMSYVGPSLPGGLLPHGKILYGTKTTIGAYLEPVMEKFPEAQALMVPVEKLEAAMRDVKNPDKLLYHKAQELKTKAKRNGG